MSEENQATEQPQAPTEGERTAPETELPAEEQPTRQTALSPQFAALKRKEKAFAQREAEHRGRLAALERREKELAAYDEMDPFDAISARARAQGRDPIDSLRKAAERLAAEGAPIDPIRKELDELKAWRAERDEYETRRQAQDAERAAARTRDEYVTDCIRAASSLEYAGALEPSELAETILTESRRVLQRVAEQGEDPNSVDAAELRDYVLQSIDDRERARFERISSRRATVESAPSRAPAQAERVAPSRGITRQQASEPATATREGSLRAAYDIERQMFRRP